MEIVKKASQLEEIAAEERKSWAKMRGDKGKTIETLLPESIHQMEEE